MTEPVKRRSYDATARQANSASTRQGILDVARSLFIERGYNKTTIAMIAAGAGVNVDTVYTLAGRKPVIVKELIEQALSGVGRPVEAEQRAHIVAQRAESDPRAKLRIYSAAIRRTHERLAPLFLALRDASSVDSEAAGVWQEISDRRARNMQKLVADVRSTVGERTNRFEFSIRDAADIAWVLNSPETYLMLTTERGWTGTRYEHYLASALLQMILGES